MPEKKQNEPVGAKPTQAEAADLDTAHEAAGDGTLRGSVPAGLTTEELRRRAREPNAGGDAAAD